MNFRERLEHNPLFFLLAALLTGFTAGVGTYQTILEIANLQVVRRDAQTSAVSGGDPLPLSANAVRRDRSYRVIPSITTIASAERIITAVRAESGLRSLLPMEANQPLSRMPRSTYGFTYAFNLVRELDDPPAKLLSAEVDVRPTTRRYFFEVMHLAGGEHFLIAFCSQADAAKLSTLDGKRARELLLAPLPLTSADTMVLMPLGDIKISVDRKVEDEEGDEVSVLEITVQ